MKYKIFNEGNTDLHIPVAHGKKKAGVMGSSGNLPNKLVIPGKAKAEEGKNHLVIEEDTLRAVFGLFERLKAGVIDPSKTVSIMPKNVKLNARLLDSGRVTVIDEKGRHLFGVGRASYDKNALDSLKDENQMLTEQADNLIKVLVADGYSEEHAAAIVYNKGKNVQEILAKKESKVTGRGMDTGETGSETGSEPVFSNLSDMTIPQLKEYAANHDPVIDLSGASKKDDILAKINESVKDSDSSEGGE